MSDADRLLAELVRRAGGRARVPLDLAWTAFRDTIRGYTGSVEARAHLARSLDELGARGALELPRGARRWDTSAEPRLPLWVRIVPPRREPEPEVDHRAVAWPPELAFVAELPRAPLLSELLAVRRFLARGGRERILVPTSERSLELFGDEKRLASLRKTSAFGAGRLSLELLRCYDVAPPLVFELGPEGTEGRPVLVLENLDSYDSFCRWNASAAAHSAIAYGHGSEFLATVRDLPRICDAARTTTVDYFGDLDPRGLEIPYAARAVLLAEAPAICLRPSERWYEALLEHAGSAQPSSASMDPHDPALGWLPERLRAAASAILTAGRRLPQEHIGLDRLMAP